MKRKQPRKKKGKQEQKSGRPTEEKGPTAVPAHPRPLPFRVVQAVRAAAEAVIDLADGAAEAINRRLEGRS